MHNDRPVLYDPINVNVTVKGRVLMDFAPDKIVSITKNEDNFISVTGGKGDVLLTVNANDSGEAEVSLLQSSPSLGYLRDLAERRALFELLITDTNNDGAFIINTQYAYVKKIPDIIRGGREGASIPVVFGIPYLERRVPGVSEILAA
ncbi:MAG: hypothetical protein LBK46_03770 [Oscillospiraceae bacterium]|jgi:hypothetical protein|nr:hypothetical protein [Oscillospiraceae bacterium]